MCVWFRVCYVYVHTCTCMYYVCLSVCMSTYMCICVRGCTHVYRRARVSVECIFIFICMFGCVLQYFGTRLVRSWPLKETRTRSRFVLVLEPMHRQFEDRFMGWSVDQYRFVQWRPDGDSLPKLRHFMWVFAFVSFSYLPLTVAFTCCSYHFMWFSVIFYQFHYWYSFMRCLWLFTLNT